MSFSNQMFDDTQISAKRRAVGYGDVPTPYNSYSARYLGDTADTRTSVSPNQISYSDIYHSRGVPMGYYNPPFYPGQYPTNASFFNQTLPAETVQGYRNTEPFLPKFPPQNFEIPDIQDSNSVYSEGFESLGMSGVAEFGNGFCGGYGRVMEYGGGGYGRGAGHPSGAGREGWLGPQMIKSPGAGSTDSSPVSQGDDVMNGGLEHVMSSSPHHHHQHHHHQIQQQLQLQHVKSEEEQLKNSSHCAPASEVISAPKKPRSPKKRKRRDPNEPQKPVSAYSLFFRNAQAAIKIRNPSATFGDVSKIVASMWDSLDDQVKNFYKRQMEIAKKEYLKQLAVYRASLIAKDSPVQSETSDSSSSHNVSVEQQQQQHQQQQQQQQHNGSIGTASQSSLSNHSTPDNTGSAHSIHTNRSSSSVENGVTTATVTKDDSDVMTPSSRREFGPSSENQQIPGNFSGEPGEDSTAPHIPENSGAEGPGSRPGQGPGNFGPSSELPGMLMTSQAAMMAEQQQIYFHGGSRGGMPLADMTSQSGMGLQSASASMRNMFAMYNQRMQQPHHHHNHRHHQQQQQQQQMYQQQLHQHQQQLMFQQQQKMLQRQQQQQDLESLHQMPPYCLDEGQYFSQSLPQSREMQNSAPAAAVIKTEIATSADDVSSAAAEYKPAVAWTSSTSLEDNPSNSLTRTSPAVSTAYPIKEEDSKLLS